ncbi:hypothetical protein C8Q74DRAFT_1344479 [Fomes fomentarius]|nr:hypothetical protein C8Q74DRAFT_1344479 [Fomes fomentarius]
MVRRIIPSPFHYAVAQLKPVKMLQDLGLNDEITLAEAQQMDTKKYLIYLYWPFQFPLPDSPWCRFKIETIGTTLIPEDKTYGITSDMVVPIAPNLDHPTGRAPVHPQPFFPFSHCYHWVTNGMIVRVHTPEGGFEHDGAISLTNYEDFALNNAFSPDMAQLDAFAEASGLSDAASESGETCPAVCSPLRGVTLNDAGLAFEDELLAVSDEAIDRIYYKTIGEPCVDTSTSSHDTATSSITCPSHPKLGTDLACVPPTSLFSDRTVIDLDVCGWRPDPITPVIALVDVWLDIENHITADTIPDPWGLIEEEKIINSIIKRGFARRVMQESLSHDTLGRGVAPSMPRAIDVHHNLHNHVAPSVESLLSLTHSSTEPSSHALASASSSQLAHNPDPHRMSSPSASHSPTSSHVDSAQQDSLLQIADQVPSLQSSVHQQSAPRRPRLKAISRIHVAIKRLWDLISLR